VQNAIGCFSGAIVTWRRSAPGRSATVEFGGRDQRCATTPQSARRSL